jgi:hypothetical protein
MKSTPRTPARPADSRALDGAMLLMLPYVGNVNGMDSAATGVPHRSSAFQALCQSLWSTPATGITSASALGVRPP